MPEHSRDTSMPSSHSEDLSQSGQAAPSAKSESSRSHRRIIIACCIIVIAALAIGAYAFASMQQTPTNTSEEPAAESAEPDDSDASLDAASSEAATTTPAPAATPAPAKAVTQPQYVAIFGDDSWEKYTPGHSDLMMLMRVDFEHHQLTLVTVPRDTRYHTADGTTCKANEVFRLGGADAACKAVSDITGIAVTQYVTIGFDGLQAIVRDLDGTVQMNLPYALSYDFYTRDYPDEYFEAGLQDVSPWRAMALSRARTGYEQYDLSQDMMRETVNRQMFTRLAQSALTGQTSPALLTSLVGSVSTNIPVQTILSWAQELEEGSSLTVYGTSGPFEGDVDAASQLWLVNDNPAGWKQLMSVVDAGQDPSTVTGLWDPAAESPIAPIATKTVIPLS